MEQLRAELSIVLGESISRLERVSEQPYAHMYSLYDRQGNAIPLMAKSFICQGIAQQEAYKLSMLARDGDIRLPTVYGVVCTHQAPYKEILLIERLRGVSAEAPTRSPDRWNMLMEQIVDGILAWHRIDSHGSVGSVDSTQENDWFCWYQQRVEVLWATVVNLTTPQLTMADRRLLYRTREALTHFFVGFDDPCVLVHGNLSLRSMLKDPKAINCWRCSIPAWCCGRHANTIFSACARRVCPANCCSAICGGRRSPTLFWRGAGCTWCGKRWGV